MEPSTKGHADEPMATLQLSTDDERLFELAEVFKVFGDSTRIRIMAGLMAGEMSVSDISAMLSMTQSAISHQLRLLKSSKLVKSRRNGKNIYYSLDDDHVVSILRQGLEHLTE